MPIVLEVFLNMVIMWELCVSGGSAILVNLISEQLDDGQEYLILVLVLILSLFADIWFFEVTHIWRNASTVIHLV